MTKMTDSGIDWIGEIPEEWKVMPIKYLVSTPVTDGPHETPILYDTGIPFLSAESVKNGILDLNFKRGYISEKDHKLFSKKVAPRKHDIFIVKSGATTGNVGIVTTDEIFDIWSPLALVRAKSDLANQKFVYYYMLSDAFIKQIQNSWSFGTQQNIGMGVIERIRLVIPSLQEQNQIADYLDQKVAQLDKAKALLEEQIATLQEYRQSLIYETVTKGLDKTVPLKESGVDWIGEIPEGWGVKRLKYVLVIKDGTHDTPDYFDEGIPLITSKNLDSIKNTIDFETAKNISFEDYQKINRRSNVSEGDIIMPMIGTIGGAVQVLTDEKFSIKNVALFKTGENQFLSRYLYYQLNSSIVNVQFKFMMSGGVQSFVSLTMLGELRVIVPDTTSMYQVTDFLDKKTAQINQMIAIKQEQIDNINQQRQTLIYDLVTGKRRV